MHYRERPPPPELARHIAALWTFRLGAGDSDVAQHAVPPDGGVLLSVALAAGNVQRVAVAGPTLAALHVPVVRGVTYLGLRATPVGGALILPGATSDWRDRKALLDALDPPRAASVRAALAGVSQDDVALERLAGELQQWLGNSPPIDPAAEAMALHIVRTHGQAPVLELAAQAGLGYRQALRRFQAAVGLQPKELARLRRIRHACLLAVDSEAASAADISAAAGYADQPHMSREFTELFGWPPRLTLEYLRRVKHQGVTP